MAKETKVGLVAGLAFIICFSVILTNRGSSPALDPQHSISSAVHRRTPTNPVINMRRSATRGQGTSPTTAFQPRNVNTAPHNGGQTKAQPTSTVANQTSSNTQTARANPPDMNQKSTRRSTQAPGEQVSQQPAMSQAQQLQRRLDEISGTSAKNKQAPTPVNRAAPVSKTPTTKQRLDQNTKPAKLAPGVMYTVKSGDTLTKIAQAHFGTKSTKMISAIFAHNRDVLSSANKLKIGMKLRIPKLSGQGASVRSSTATVGNTKRNSQSTQAINVKSFRLYQVRPGDRYISIAREQLGDAGRWTELAELNKDKFPDPQRIRTGVRIKIPMDAVAAGSPQ